ncbi:MAG TPA: Ig-like domain-containing protein, partial [Gemmataceae bacterium]
WDGPVTPTGTVTFYDGQTPLGTAELTVVNGQVQATFTTSALGLGSHTILAIYSGDSTYADSGASMGETIYSGIQ